MSESHSSQSPFWTGWELVHCGSGLPLSVMRYVSVDDVKADAADTIAVLNDRFDFGDSGTKLGQERTLLRRTPLPMLGDFGAWLYEAIQWTGDSDTSERARLVGFDIPNQKHADWELLDWSSAPIHELNDTRGLTWPADVDAVSAYLAYLKYFCTSMTGDEGTFEVLQIEPCLPDATNGDSGEGDDEFIAAARILYGDHIFDAQLRLSLKDGQVEMLDDEPVGEDELENIDKAFIWLESTERKTFSPVARIGEFWKGWELVHCGTHVHKSIAPFLPKQAAGNDDQEAIQELNDRFDFGGRHEGIKPDACVLRRMFLPFLGQSGAWLYEIVQYENDTDSMERARIVRFKTGSVEIGWQMEQGAEKGGRRRKWEPLDWTSAPIHELNSKVGLHWESDAAKQAALEAYLRYFCGSFEGDEGTFIITRFIQSPLLSIPDEGDEDAPTDTDTELHVAVAEILYGGTLFSARLELNATTGLVEMKDDTQLSASQMASVDPTFKFWAAARRVPFIRRGSNQIDPGVFLACMRADNPVEALHENFSEWDSSWTEIRVAGNVLMDRQEKVGYDWNLLDGSAGSVLENIKKIRITGNLDMRSARLEQGLNLSNWEINRRLIMTSSVCEGDLQLKNVVVGSEIEDVDRAPGIDLERVETLGNVKLQAVTLRKGSLSGEGSDTKGSVSLWSVDIAGNINFCHAHMSALYGRAPALSRPSRVGGKVLLDGVSIEGPIYFGAFEIGDEFRCRTPRKIAELCFQPTLCIDQPEDDPALLGVKIRNGLTIRNAQLRGSLDCTGIDTSKLEVANSHLHGGVFFHRTPDDLPGDQEIPAAATHELLFRDCRIDGELSLSAVKVAGNIHLFGVSARFIRALENTSCEDLRMDGIRCDVLKLQDLHVKKELRIPHAEVRTSIRIENSHAPQIDLRNVNVGGDMTLRAIDGLDSLVADGDVDGNLKLVGAVVNGEARQARELTVELKLSGISVGGEIEIRNFAVDFLDLSDASSKRDVYLGSSSSGESGSDHRIVCNHLKLRGLECKGDVDLTGLQVPEQEPRAQRGGAAHEQPAIDARGAQVDRFLLATGENEKLRFAELPGGKIELAGAKAGHISISGVSFNKAPAPAEKENGSSWATLIKAVKTLRWASVFILALAAVSVLLVLMQAFLTDSGNTETWYLSKWGFLIVALAVFGYRVRSYGQQQAHNLSDYPDPRKASAWHLLIFRQLGEGTVGCLHSAAMLRLGLSLMFLLPACLGFWLQATSAADEILWLGGLLLGGLLATRYAQVFAATSHALDVAKAAAARKPYCWSCGWIDQLLAWDVLAMVVLHLLIWPVSLGLDLNIGVSGSIGFSVFSIVGIAVLSLGVYRWRSLGIDLALEQLSPEEASAASVDRGPIKSSTRLELLTLSETVLGFRDWMQIATYNHLTPRRQSRLTARVRLERATVGQLEIKAPIPEIIDFTNLQVDHWELPDEQGEINVNAATSDDLAGESASESRRDLQFLDLLDHAAEFKSDFYAQIERDLRNKGDRAAAERIHRAVRRQTQWRETRWVQTTLMFLHSLIGYGTERAPIMAFMLGWFLFTTYWFAADYPQAVEITPAAHATLAEVRGGDDLVAKQQLEELLLSRPNTVTRVGRAAALAIRYHVPIIAWDIWPYVQPKGKVVWAYTTFVGIVHWILWPLLIASLIPALIPRREE